MYQKIKNFVVDKVAPVIGDVINCILSMGATEVAWMLAVLLVIAIIF